MEERKIKMKTLVVYYSMSGDVKSAAERIAKENLTDKKIYLYASSASGNADKCFGKMKEALGCMENIPTLSLVDPKKKKNINNNNKEKIEEFCKIIQKDCEL